MALVQGKRFMYVLRKASVLLIGVGLSLVGIIVCLIYFPDYQATNGALEGRRTILGYMIGDLVHNNPSWPVDLRDKLTQLKTHLQADRLAQAASLARDLQEESLLKDDQQIASLYENTQNMIAAEDSKHGLLTYCFLGVGSLLAGIICLAIGLPQARRLGRFVSAEQLKANMRKLEMPEFPSKDFLKKLRVNNIHLFVVVNRFGHVEHVELIEGPEVMFPFIVKAIRQWKFDPFIYKGKNVSVFGELKINVK